MEEIKQLVYNYAKAIHTQNEKDFKALWSSKENTLISLTNQFNEIDAIYNDFLIGGIQRLYELIIEGIEIHQIDDNKALLDNTRAQTSKIVPTTLITA
mgnify:CR=1 FL=1